MTKRVLSLLLLLAAMSFAGPLLTPDSPTPFAETDTTSIDLSSLPMDDIEVISQAAAPASQADEVSVAALGRVIAAVPEPATYGLAAVALLAAGTFRRRK
jgi:hypothetical protein